MDDFSLISNSKKGSGGRCKCGNVSKYKREKKKKKKEKNDKNIYTTKHVRISTEKKQNSSLKK